MPIKFSRWFLFSFFGILSSVGSSWALDQKIFINEGIKAIQVEASAPIPREVSIETQARAISREAAIVRAQAALLQHILQKKTKSRKTLAEAEVPSLNLQDEIRGRIKGARVAKTIWKKSDCYVTLVLDKKFIKDILRNN